MSGDEPDKTHPCPGCGYMLTGLAPSGQCPECGRAFDQTTLTRRSALKQSRKRRLVIAAIVGFICMYAPYSWLLFVESGWNNYQWFWVKRWLILPGLLPMLWCRDRGWLVPAADPWMMGVVSALLFAGYCALACRSRRWLIVSSIVLLLLSIAQAFVAHAIYRA